jgi:hypothetical protein
MKMVKSLLLGSVAGLAAVAGAQAADLPVKAKPVEYVKICSLYGAGFYYIPGTDTCIRIGGHIRAEINFNSRGSGQQSWGVGDGTATQTRDRDFFTTRTRGYLYADTRTQTTYGTLRTFQTYRLTADTGTGTVAGATAVNLDNAMVQWAGFTIGRTGTSFLESPWTYSTNYLNGHLGIADIAPSGFVLAYTHQFGNGISASLSLEDPKYNIRGYFNGTSIAGGVNLTTLPGVLGAPDTRGGNTWPDIVGQFRIEQAWGGFHVAGLLRNNHVSYGCAGQVGCTEVTGFTPSDKLAGGVNAALKFNTPTGVNDALYIQGSWGRGVSNATFGSSNHTTTMFGLYGGSNIRYGSIAFTPVFDSVYNSAVIAGANNPTGAAIAVSGQQLTTTYGGNIAFEHGWNAEWRTSVFGGVEKIDYNATANAILCSQYRSAVATPGLLSNFNTTCNMDYTMWGVGSRTTWSPVKDLLIGAEVFWTNHHSGNNGATYAQPTVNNFKPAALYEVKDQNVLSGMFSVRRYF